MSEQLPPHLQGLNPRQQEAVEATEGPLLILAGAGSGKTRVLTRRVAHLLYKGVAPWRILAVTFTNKAAAEMKERVAELVGDAGRDVWVSTFHSACVRILRREATHLGYSTNFVIYDTDDQHALLKDILLQQRIDPKTHPPNGFRSEIDRAKNRLMDPIEVEDLAAHGHFRHHTAQVYAAYQKRLKAANAVDFNDLINLVVTLFKDHPQVLESYQDRFQYLLVDEYQDTNHAQYQLVRLLSAKRRNVAVVGDDDQSIYSFRGADIRNILDFEADFPEARVVVLDQNYRSTERILKAATAVVSHNSARKEKALWTDSGEGEPIRRIQAANEEEEAMKVAGEISRLMKEGRAAGEFALIYRTNARSRLFEMALRHRRIPYVIVGARKFYERREVRDLLGYLKLVVNPADEMGFLRVINVPKRGIGDKSVESLREHAARHNLSLLEAARAVSKLGGRGAKQLDAFVALIDRARDAVHTMAPGDLLHQIAEESGYLAALRAEDTRESQERIQNIDALCQDVASRADPIESSADPVSRLQEFLDQASLTGQDEELPDGGGAVTLLTAHLAKGLEFPVVFVVGMVEGAFPHARSSEREEDLAEERRLVYVAFTRAMQRLYICQHRARRNWNGFMEPVRPSRFLTDVPRDLFHQDGPFFRAPRTPGSLNAARERRSSFAERHGLFQPAAPRSAPPEPEEPEYEEVYEERDDESDEGEEQQDREPRFTYLPDGPEEYQVGVTVLHPQLGEGVIQQRAGTLTSLRLVVRFHRHGRKTVFPRHVPLEIVEV
jgi:DNA helicase-2/ATP-dependent DNA helicase PcrA